MVLTSHMRFGPPKYGSRNKVLGINVLFEFRTVATSTCVVFQHFPGSNFSLVTNTANFEKQVNHNPFKNVFRTMLDEVGVSWAVIVNTGTSLLLSVLHSANVFSFTLLLLPTSIFQLLIRFWKEFDEISKSCYTSSVGVSQLSRAYT